MDAQTLEFASRLSDSEPARDRRRSERRTALHSMKMFIRGTGRYAPGMTSNVSEGGALLRIDRDQCLRVGDEITVAINEGDQPVVSHGSMRPARVVRIVPMDCHHQAVAISYDAAMEAAMAA